MSHTKRRTFQHIMEDQSFLVLRSILPKEWVIRDYKPDYGIDLTVELFRYLDEEETKADTLGEMFFAQLKSQKQVDIRTITVHPRYNVEKKALEEDRAQELKIQALRFQIDTDELLTVQAMGAGLPILLFLIPLDSKRVFFVCLNDLIDKVLIPSEPNFAKDESKVIYIPIDNEVTANPASLIPLRFYAKRSKLYAAFSKFSYQQHEMGYLRDGILHTPVNQLAQSPELQTVAHFIETIRRYDFWESTQMWTPIADCFQDIRQLQTLIERIRARGTLAREDFSMFTLPAELRGLSDEELLLGALDAGIVTTWHRLKNLNNMHEEICREWCLPTYLAQGLSYPVTKATSATDTQ